MTATQRRVVLADGASTTVETWGERGPIVLCVHGITSSRRSWTRFAERLASTHRVVAYDQRGHGDSASVRGPMSHAQSLSDLREVAKSGGEPIDILVGHSWGGAVAILGGLDLRPARVVVIDPMIFVPAGTFEAEYVDDLREFFALDPARREPAIRAMYDGLAPVDIDAKLHAMTHMSVSTLGALGTENHVDAGMWDLRERLIAYPIPLLILAAGIESVMSPDDLAFIRERGGPHVRIHTFANDGHNLHRTAFDGFVTAVETFA